MIIPDLPLFIRFSTSHLAVMFLSIFLFIYIPYRIYKNPEASWINILSQSLGLLLIGNEVGWVIYKLSLGHTYWAEFMPFELCTINAYLLGYLLLLSPSYAIFKLYISGLWLVQFKASSLHGFLRRFLIIFSSNILSRTAVLF